MEVFDQEKESGHHLLKFVWEKWLTLVASILVAALGAGIVTFFMAPQYRSTGIIFPTNSNKLEAVMNNPQFGFDLDADRLMQILESRQMQDGVIEKFNLAEYYELDTAEPRWRGELGLKFIEDITYFRSKYMSVVIAAETNSPQLSANIVNYIIDTLDIMREDLFSYNMNLQLDVVRTEYEQNQKLVEQLSDTLEVLFSEDPVFQEIYLQFRMGDWSKGLNIAPENLKKLNPDKERLITSYVYELERLFESKQVLDDVANKVSKPFPRVYQVDRAVPSTYKVSPSYRVNISMAGALAFLLTLVVLYLRKPTDQ